MPDTRLATRIACCAALLFAGRSAAQAASFDCKKATTVQEQAICRSPELSAADDTMAATYQTVLATAPAEMKKDVLEGQRMLVRKMATECKDGVMAPADMQECLMRDYSYWIEELQEMVLHRNGMTFVTRHVFLTAPGRGTDAGDTGTLTASWPEAAVETPEWRDWDRAVETATQRLATHDETASAGRWQDSWAEGHRRSDVSVSLDSVTPQMVSATVFAYIDGQSAGQPNAMWKELNWLLKERRALRAADMFRPGSGWEMFLQLECVSGMRKQFGDKYEDVLFDRTLKTMLESIVMEPTSWRLNASGLTMVMNPSSLTSPANPVEPITVPWEALRQFLQPGFVVPQ